ncbi:centromeric protein E [Nematocida sp. AWRm80]|nr:centromeric protein E [Nematocida sp. AWRm80]
MEENHRVSVGIRIRPPATDTGGCESANQIFSSHSNEEIYNLFVSPHLQAMEHSTIFTYGRTGSGKTYTMFGDGKVPGIIQLILKDILQQYNMVSIKCVEVYNEVVTDLLSGESIRIVEENNRTKMMHCQHAVLKNHQEIETFISMVIQKRKTYQTEYNMCSSRSHSVIEVNAVGLLINLVDLAGNEKLAVDENRRKEGMLINKSLLTLGKVIDQLHTDTQHVSYRESKLTRLLQNTLSSGTIICICTVLDMSDTLTIKFAERLKRIKTPTKPLEKSKDQIIIDLQLQVKTLSEELQALKVQQPVTAPVLVDKTTETVLENASTPGTLSLHTPFQSSESLVQAGNLNNNDVNMGGTEIIVVPNDSIDRSNTRVNLYEMIYSYIKSETSHEMTNTLTPEEIDKVHVTVTKRKRGKEKNHRYQSIFKEFRTEIKPYLNQPPDTSSP